MESGAATIQLPAPTTDEEWANRITHGFGLLLSPVALAVLVSSSMTQGEISLTGCIVFGITLVFMYAASTLYHSFPVSRLKPLLRLLDHVAIYLLIAGSYTAFALCFFDGGLPWALMGLEWGIALFGIVYKVFSTNRYGLFSMILYLVMGGLGGAVVDPLAAVAPAGCVTLFVVGGVCYMVGVVFFAWERLPYNHAIWHVFVLAGSLCHCLAVALFV